MHSSPEELVSTLCSISFSESCLSTAFYPGQFLPGDGATPNIGEVGKPEFVEEDKVELIVNDNDAKAEIKMAVDQLKKVSTMTY